MKTLDSLAIWCLRESSQNLCECLAGGAKTAVLFKGYEFGNGAQKEEFRKQFYMYRQWILVMATGIASRFLSGLPENKLTDPCVVVVDEAGRHAIAYLSGHEGGGNELAYEVASRCGAIPVVTTATEALKPLVLGVGCRKGVTSKAIDQEVNHLLLRCSRELDEIREVATVSIKAKEPGLLEWCDQHHLPLRIVDLTLLQDRPWVTKSSSWVQKTIGVAGVCEPCALICAPRGRLISPKHTGNGIALALVEDSWKREGV